MLPWAKVCQRTDGDDYLCFDFSCDALHSPCNYSMQLDFSLEKLTELSITNLAAYTMHCCNL